MSMKGMFKGLAVVMMLAAGLVSTAAAQELPKTRAMKIDFDFYAGKTVMPAGEYEFQLVSSTGPHKLIRIREINSDKQVLLTAIPNRNAQNLDSGSVGFNKYGDQYFLTGVQLGDRNYFHTVLKTSMERDIAKQFNGRRINTQSSGQ